MKAMCTWSRCWPKATPATASKPHSACSATSACTWRRCGGTSSPIRRAKNARRFPRRRRWRCTSARRSAWRRDFRPRTSRTSTSRTPACARVSRRCPMRSCSSTRTRAASCCCSWRPMRWRRSCRSASRARSSMCRSPRRRHALEAVIHSNQRLFDHLDVERFFFSVRPYYKPYMVGRQEYRGANAGDFSGINEIDLLLGLCRANDPYYAQLLVDKMSFMPPADQARLRECMRHESFLDELLALAPHHAREDWFQRNARAYLELCELFGRICQPAPRRAREALHRSCRRQSSARRISRASPPAARRCRCCCVRSKCCATCGLRRIAPTSRRATRTSSASGRCSSHRRRSEPGS